MINATILITNKLATDSGFGIVQDGTFAQVFISSRLMRAASMQVDGLYDVVLVENDADVQTSIPWRASHMQPDQSSARTPAPTPAEPSIEDKIMAMLAMGYMTTGEITAELQATGTTVRDRLLAMFNQHKIVRADVHGKPNLQRASFCLWAANVDAFTTDGE